MIGPHEGLFGLDVNMDGVDKVNAGWIQAWANWGREGGRGGREGGEGRGGREGRGVREGENKEPVTNHPYTTYM